jgi:hypothetical protein
MGATPSGCSARSRRWRDDGLDLSEVRAVLRALRERVRTVQPAEPGHPEHHPPGGLHVRDEHRLRAARHDAVVLHRQRRDDSARLQADGFSGYAGIGRSVSA